MIHPEQSSVVSGLAVTIVSKKSLNTEQLLYVHPEYWTTTNCLKLGLPNKFTLVSYFEDPAQVKPLLKYAPWHFNNSWLVVGWLVPGMAGFKVSKED